MVQGDSRDGLYLVCRVRQRCCALDLAQVVEIMRTLPIQPVAAAPQGVLGLSIIRGQPIPVIDAGALLGETARGKPSRLATIRCGDRIAALAFEDILGVRRLSEHEVRELPPLLRAGEGGALDALALLDAELVFVLARARLLPDEVWTAVQVQPA